MFTTSTVRMKILLEELERIQDQQGYIKEADINELAKQMDIPRASLYGTLSFYSRFYTAPQGKHIIRVCKSVVCGMNDSKAILEAISHHLNIQPGETTEDRLFTLEMMECLGHCEVSPAISIDDVIFGNLSPERVIEVLDEYASAEEVS